MTEWEAGIASTKPGDWDGLPRLRGFRLRPANIERPGDKSLHPEAMIHRMPTSWFGKAINKPGK